MTRWLSQLERITNCSKLKNEILDYLSDNKNGNTYPDSFRMMLIKELTEQTNASQSSQFDVLLQELKNLYSVPRKLSMA